MTFLHKKPTAQGTLGKMYPPAGWLKTQWIKFRLRRLIGKNIDLVEGVGFTPHGRLIDVGTKFYFIKGQRPQPINAVREIKVR